MQKNNAADTAKEIIKDLRDIFGDRVSDIVLSEVTDMPYKMFHIECVMYNYFELVFNYDRGHFGGAIAYGNYAISLKNDIEWDDNCDYKLFWKNVDEQIRLRIPDKYLAANGWL